MEVKMKQIPNSKRQSETRLNHSGEKLFVVINPASGYEWDSFKCLYCGTGNTFGIRNWAKPLFKLKGYFRTYVEADIAKHDFLPEDFNLEFQCPNCRMLYRAFVKH
jgi:hypothetical protein